MKMLDQAAVSYQVVLTKIDKLTPGALVRCKAETSAGIARHTAAHPELHAVSAVTGAGIAELRAALGMFAVPAALD